MKRKFKSQYHKRVFTSFIRMKVRNPYISRYEYIAAVYLLSADRFLWRKTRKNLTGYSVDFEHPDLNGISTEGYALYKAAKSLYTGNSEISLNELGDDELIDHATLFTIFCGVMLLRNGIGMLNWEVTA